MWVACLGGELDGIVYFQHFQVSALEPSEDGAEHDLWCSLFSGFADKLTVAVLYPSAENSIVD